MGELTGQVLAFGDTIGTRHGQRPHVTLDIDLDTYLARRGGRLAIPGEQPVLVPSETIGRVLCDADLTPILTTPTGRNDRDRTVSDADDAASRHGASRHGAGGPGSNVRADHDAGHDHGHGPRHADGAEPDDPEQPTWTGQHVPGWRDTLAAALRAQTRTLLWLGRTRRTADTRLWTAVVARDEHCIFPDCRVDPSRCEVHHPLPWELGGTTDPANSALLCVRHHHAVYEGGWLMTPVDGADPLAPGYWRFDPPHPRPQPW